MGNSQNLSPEANPRLNPQPEPPIFRRRGLGMSVIIGLAAAGLCCGLAVVGFILFRPQITGLVGGAPEGGEVAQPGEEEGGVPVTSTPLAPPLPPDNILLAQRPVLDIPLGWDDNSDNEDGFRIYRRRIDILGDTEEAGETGPNEDTFVDRGLHCGATYQYTVASFNAAGESPSTECWVITMPPCPSTHIMRLAVGVDYGRNFLTGELGPEGDFYLAIGPDGVFMLMADQPGQNGLIDLGDLGLIPLTDVDLPDPPNWQPAVPAIPGHTYVALARDGETLIIFTISKLGDPTVLEYIIYKPAYEITQVPCPDLSGRTPGGPCISGDGVCDPTCVPLTDQIGQPVPYDGSQTPDDFPAPTDGGTPTLTANYPPGAVPPGAGQPDQTGVPTLTYTERDLDCTNQPCVSGDGICNPECATAPNFTNWPGMLQVDPSHGPVGYDTPGITALYVDLDCGRNPCITGDGVCDPTCVPNPDDPGRQPDDGVYCYDADGDGKEDNCVQTTPTAAAGLPVCVRAVGQTATVPCVCEGDDLICGEAVYENSPQCNVTPTCRCDGATLYCDDGTSYQGHPSCQTGTQACWCEGTTLVCPDQRTVEGHPICTGDGTQPGGGSRRDGDCGGRCIQDGICTPNCDPYYDPYDDPTTDDPGNDVAGVPPTFAAAPNDYQTPPPPSAVDPDCGDPCTDTADPCTCLPTTNLGTLATVAPTYNSTDRLDQCLPQCACEYSDYVCRTVTGEELRRVVNSGQCEVLVCACEGTDYVCRYASTGSEAYRTRNAQQCAPARCECVGRDYVCFDAAGREVSRSPNDQNMCPCLCRGPEVYCGTSYDHTNETECGCSCEGTTLRCRDGTVIENAAYCMPRCYCRCSSPGYCYDTCTQKPCTP